MRWRCKRVKALAGKGVDLGRVGRDLRRRDSWDYLEAEVECKGDYHETGGATYSILQNTLDDFCIVGDVHTKPVSKGVFNATIPFIFEDLLKMKCRRLRGWSTDEARDFWEHVGVPIEKYGHGEIDLRGLYE